MEPYPLGTLVKVKIVDITKKDMIGYVTDYWKMGVIIRGKGYNPKDVYYRVCLFHDGQEHITDHQNLTPV